MAHERLEKIRNNNIKKLELKASFVTPNLEKINVPDVEASRHRLQAKANKLSDKLRVKAGKTLEQLNFNPKVISKMGEISRITTKYLNWPYFWFLKKSILGPKIPYVLQEGIHYIYALPGKGKSSLVFNLIEELRLRSGYGAYINAAIEKERYDEIEDIFYKYHPTFEVKDFFGLKKHLNEDGEARYESTQLKKFAPGYSTIVFDEFMSILNHRVNNTKEYLNIFLAMMQTFVQRRHKQIKRVYILNQLDTTDIQLQSVFDDLTEVTVDLDVSYDYWIKTGELKKHILGWWIETYKYGKKGKKNSDNKILVQETYIKRTADFEYFDTLSQKNKDKDLPVDKIEGIYWGK